MTDRQDFGQPPFPPRYPQQGYGQQWPQDQPLQGQQSDPGWQQYPQQAPLWQGAPPQQQPQRPDKKRHIVRNILAGIGGLVIVIIVIAAAASGGNHTVNTTGSGGTPSTGSTPGGASAAGKNAVIGSTITLAGNGGGEQMAVTVTKVITSAQASDSFETAPAGDRLYAVQFRLRDTGSAAYSDSPSNGAQVVDSAGQSYESGIESVTGCTSFPGTENIAAGQSGLGCIVFEVPKSAKITEVQFTLDSGMGPQTGQWTVTGQQ